MRPAVLGNFVTAGARCRAASHLQRPLPGRCHQPVSLAAQENRGCGSDPRSEAARPGPLRATSAATNRAPAPERGRGWAAADQRVGARGRSPALRPTCWPQALLPDRPSFAGSGTTGTRLLLATNHQSQPRPADSAPRGILAILHGKDPKLSGITKLVSPHLPQLRGFCCFPTFLPLLVIEMQTIEAARPYNVHSF
ncbi:hypothetical protein NN561_004840 [Cricetulus griseus]